jgi:polygalacturonase
MMALPAATLLMAALTSGGVSAATGGLGGGGLPRATGDPRDVDQPEIPRSCAVLHADLSTADGTFSSADESAPPDTARIQAALDSCAGASTGDEHDGVGGPGDRIRAVELAAGDDADAFLSAPLTVREDEVLVVDDGVTLYASRNPADYQISGADTCGTVSVGGPGLDTSDGCYPFITLSGSASGVMGTRGHDGSLGIIDGRGEMTMVGSSVTWWQNAANANGVGGQNNPMLIQSNGADNLTIYQIELKNSAAYHIRIVDGMGLTVWGTMIDTPAAGARNTDGIDPVSTSDVTIRDDMVQDGDDCVSIKTQAGQPSRNITVRDTHCYGTHGISIGSQTGGGVSNMLVLDSTLNGYDSLGNKSTDDNGIRIKSDALQGGVVERVTYSGVCMTGIERILFFNPDYSSGGTLPPTFKDIVIEKTVSMDSYSSTTDTGSLFAGYDADHPLQIELDDVHLDVTRLITYNGLSSQDAQVYLRNSNVVPAGTDVTVTTLPGGGPVPTCTVPAFGYPASTAR